MVRSSSSHNPNITNHSLNRETNIKTRRTEAGSEIDQIILCSLHKEHSQHLHKEVSNSRVHHLVLEDLGETQVVSHVGSIDILRDSVHKGLLQVLARNQLLLSR